MFYLKEYMIAVVVFLIIDMIWLGFIAKGLYSKELGFLLSNNPNWLAAIVFYLFYTAGLVFFVINPAFDKGSLSYALMAGAFFGAIAYSTYDLTNLATIQNWPIKIVIIDIIWGAMLSGMVSGITYYILNIFK